MNPSERALEDEEARLASASLAAGDPTGWFDRLCAAGAAGRVPLPWSRRDPHSAALACQLRPGQG